MSANQIIIPIALLFLLAFVIMLVIKSRRLAKANAQREHKPNVPADGRDKAAMARSIAEGHSSANQF